MVVIDGDNVGAVARLRQTEKCIQPPRTDDEPVVILVPTWSTETWLLPADETADETTSSKHRIRVLTREMFTLAAKRVINGPDPDRLPAINLARVELRRIAL